MIPPAERERRCTRLRDAMAREGLDGLLAFAPAWRRENVRYLTGEPIHAPHAFAYLPAVGAPAAFGTAAGGAIADVRPYALAEPGELLARLGEDLGSGDTLGIAHADLLPYDAWAALEAALVGVRLVPATKLMDRARLVKSDWELERIRRAATICDRGWQAFLDALRPGVPEYMIVAEVEAALKAEGAEDNFMIIASGGDEVRGMTPPSARRLQPGDMVRTELTPQWEGYWAQICRSAVLGRAAPGQRDSWSLFEEAVQAGLGTVRAGVTAHDVAKAENDVFRAHGYGEYCTSEYTRVRGHGHGLHLDEFPVIEGAETVLEPGAVLIVHPNTFTPLAGYHVLGDPVVVTETGHEPLLTTPRDLAEVTA
jgi:Xaa-Pro dipeptidase